MGHPRRQEALARGSGSLARFRFVSVTTECGLRNR